MTSQPWEKDYGNDKRTTSIDLLLRWILSEGNFVQWHSGKDERGQPVSKTALMEDLRRDMVRFGITHRTTNDLQQKLLSILQSFEKAYMWMKTEGKTLRKQGKEQESRGEIDLLYYFSLEDILKKYVPFRTLRSQNRTGPSVPVASKERLPARPTSSTSKQPAAATEKLSSPLQIANAEKLMAIPASPRRQIEHVSGHQYQYQHHSNRAVHRPAEQSKPQSSGNNAEVDKFIRLEELRIQEKIHEDETALKKRKLDLKAQMLEVDMDIKRKRMALDTIYAQIDLISALNAMNIPSAEIMKHLKKFPLQ